jgi:hypothetical protein
LDCKWEIMYDLYGNKVSTIDPQGYRDKKWIIKTLQFGNIEIIFSLI